MGESNLAEQTQKFDQFQNEARAAVDGALAEILSSVEPDAISLSDAMRYAVLAPGKRLRPLIFLSVYCDHRGADYAPVLQVAAALELLHAASLIHDDLPALDNDVMRRGQKTCHLAFDEGTAILAGDALVPLALLTVLRSGFKSSAKMAAVLADTYIKLCQGQQLDLLSGPGQPDAATVARLKTGALFAASFALPGIALDLPKEICATLYETGASVGLAFQLADDFADQPGLRDSFDTRKRWDETIRLIEHNLRHLAELSPRAGSAYPRTREAVTQIISAFPQP